MNRNEILVIMTTMNNFLHTKFFKRECGLLVPQDFYKALEKIDCFLMTISVALHASTTCIFFTILYIYII